MVCLVPWSTEWKHQTLSLNPSAKTSRTVFERKIYGSNKFAAHNSGGAFGRRSAKVQGKGILQQFQGLVPRIEGEGWTHCGLSGRETRAIHSSLGLIGRQRICRAHAGVVDLVELLQSAGETALTSPQPGLLLGSGANTLVYILGNRVLLRGLTYQGVLSSWVLGSLVFSAFGARGYCIVCLYFLLGSLVGLP